MSNEESEKKASEKENARIGSAKPNNAKTKTRMIQKLDQSFSEPVKEETRIQTQCASNI